LWNTINVVMVIMVAGMAKGRLSLVITVRHMNREAASARSALPLPVSSPTVATM
jgi:hypothetical protein